MIRGARYDENTTIDPIFIVFDRDRRIPLRKDRQTKFIFSLREREGFPNPDWVHNSESCGDLWITTRYAINFWTGSSAKLTSSGIPLVSAACSQADNAVSWWCMIIVRN
jgi:hypothetical protein